MEVKKDLLERHEISARCVLDFSNKVFKHLKIMKEIEDILGLREINRVSSQKYADEFIKKGADL